MQSGNKTELTLEEVTRAARRLGFGLRPWIVRQQNTRGFNTATPGRNQNSGEPQQSPRLNQSINSGARQQNPIRRQMKSDCSIDVKGYRFFTMERLFYALQLLSLGDRKFIGQLAKYSRMDYVRKCVNTRFELASRSLQDKWLDEQFQTWTQIIMARILSDPVFKQALLDSAGSPLCDPEESVYATALTSSRKMCVQRKLLTWPSWITLPTRVTRAQVLA